MMFTNGDIAEIISLSKPGTKVSIYLPVTDQGPRSKMLQVLIARASRLLEESRDLKLLGEFTEWIHKEEKKLSELKGTSLVILFSRSYRRVLWVERELPPRVIVAPTFHLKPLLFLRPKPSAVLAFDKTGLRDPQQVVYALREGRVSQLLVSLDAVRWGRIDPETGRVVFHRRQLDAQDEDVLDDMVEIALGTGVDVRVLRQVELPERTEVVAFLRSERSLARTGSE